VDSLRGHRIDDPPPKEQPLAFRATLAARKYPVQVALVIALIAVCVPVYMLVNSNHDLRQSNRDLRNALILTASNRKAVVNVFCRVINTNAATANTQTKYLQGLIVGGAKSSRPFEHVFKSLGLPPYKKRLAQARRQAGGLGHLKVPPLNCRKLDRSLVRQIKELKSGT
jgi:hypothetical protein